MPWRWAVGAALKAALLSAALVPRVDAETIAVKVIVNPSVTGKTLKKAVLVEIFLRRADKWGGGAPIRPVDQVSSAPARQAFNERMLGFSTLDVQQYWAVQIARGKAPPQVVKTEDQVIAFVAANAGAIGYLASSTPVPDTVRVVEIE